MFIIIFVRLILEKIEKKITALWNLQRLHEIQEAVIWPVFGDMDKKNEIPEVSFDQGNGAYFANAILGRIFDNYFSLIKTRKHTRMDY